MKGTVHAAKKIRLGFLVEGWPCCGLVMERERRKRPTKNQLERSSVGRPLHVVFVCVRYDEKINVPVALVLATVVWEHKEESSVVPLDLFAGFRVVRRRKDVI